MHFIAWSSHSDETVPASRIKPYDSITKGVHETEKRGVDDPSSYSTSGSNYSTTYYGNDSNVSGQSAHGIVGLNNLGNTCYLNSILQCLSNTAPLVMLMTDSARLETCINPRSKLGKGGKLARAYGKLLENVSIYPQSSSVDAFFDDSFLRLSTLIYLSLSRPAAMLPPFPPLPSSLRRCGRASSASFPLAPSAR